MLYGPQIKPMVAPCYVLFIKIKGSLCFHNKTARLATHLKEDVKIFFTLQWLKCLSV